MLTHSIRLVSYLLALRVVGCVLYTILHTYRYEKVEFFFNFTPRMFTYPGKVEKKINFLTVELKIFSTGVEYM